MKTKFIHRTATTLFYVICSTGFCSSCQNDKDVSVPITQTGTPVKQCDLKSIERHWRQRIAYIPLTSKNRPQALLDAMINEIERLNDKALDELHQQILQIADYVPQGFRSTFLEALLEIYLQRQNNAAIQYLLREDCPRNIGLLPTEVVLVKSYLPHPIHLLAESFRASKNIRNQWIIVSMFHDAFPTLDGALKSDRPPGFPRWQVSDSAPCDQEQRFIERCVHWLDEHEGRLKYNEEYLSSSPTRPTSPPLFIVVEGEKK